MQNARMTPSARLKSARMDAGFRTATEAANRLRVKTPTYLGHENGSRAFDLADAQLYGQHFGVSPYWLLTGDGPKSGGAVRGVAPDGEQDPFIDLASAPRLRVLGEVAAGAWLEVDPIAEYDAAHFEVPVPLDPRYPKGKVFGLVVRGTSINKIAADGDVLVCLDVSAGIEVENGDLVVVERRRAQEGLREVSAKRIKRGRHVIEFWPESTDPRWQEPLTIRENTPSNQDMDVRVLARVEWVFRQVRRP